MTRNLILLDMDHVITDAAWRDSMIGTEDWDTYHSQAVSDKPNHDIATLVNSLSSENIEVVVVTARPEKWAQMTSNWLVDNGVLVDQVLYREADDFQKSPDCKRTTLEREYGPEWPDRVIVAIDDNVEVIAMYKASNVSTLLCDARKQD